MNRESKATANALLAALEILTEEEILALTENPGKVKEYCGTLVAEKAKNIFVIALSDNEVQEQFPQFADRLAPWRKYAAALGYTGPVAYRVKQGFTLKAHASLVGPCYDKLNYLQGWNFADDPTTNSLVFWVPRLAEKSTGKSIKQMEKLRAQLRKQHALPANHCNSFGSIGLLFALILAHFKRTGERVPLSQLYAASDVLIAGGGRLIVGDFSSSGLDCDDWCDDSFGYGSIGFFLLGMEALGQ